MQGGSVGLSELVEKELEQFTVERGQGEEEALPSERLDTAVEIALFQFVLGRSQRFNATQRQATAVDRNQPKAAFMLCPDPNGLGRPRQLPQLRVGQQLALPLDRRGSQHRLAEPVGERGAKTRFGGGLFLMCVGRATARRAPKTWVAVYQITK